MVRSIVTGEVGIVTGSRDIRIQREKAARLPIADSPLPIEQPCEKLAIVNRQAAIGNRQSAIYCKSVSRVPRLPVFPYFAKGFTLLELMIVITIIIILAAVALPQYQRTIMHSREAVLRDDLFKMRSLLDQYAADKGKLPQSLEDLVSAGYMRELPQDPFTGQADWTLTTGDDPNSTETQQGVVDLHSASTDIATDGRPYSEW